MSLWWELSVSRLRESQIWSAIVDIPSSCDRLVTPPQNSLHLLYFVCLNQLFLFNKFFCNCLFADMAECKVLKLSSLLELPLLYPHPKLHPTAQSPRRPSSARTQLLSHNNLPLVIVICLPHTRLTLTSVVSSIRSSPLVQRPPSWDPHTCWTHQSMSIVVIILVIAMSQAAITTASPSVQRRLLSSTSNQLQKPISRSIDLTIEF